MMHVSVLVLFYRLVVFKDGSVHYVHLFIIIYGYIEINVKTCLAPVFTTILESLQGLMVMAWFCFRLY